MQRLRLSPDDGAETSFTGLELATWRVPAGGHVSESDCDADISSCVENQGSGYALVALVFAIAGLLLGLFGIAKGPGWCASGGFAAILGIGIQSFQPLGPTVTFRIGYWLILLLFVVLVWVHAVQARRRRRAAREGSVGHTPDSTSLADTDSTA